MTQKAKKWIAHLSLCALVWACFPLQAMAGDPKGATQDLADLEAQAAEAYQAGQYQKAIDLMLDAYDRDPHPNYQLNIAVSYSKLGKCDEARRWAQRALKPQDPALPQEARPIAEQVLNECKEIKPKDGEVVITPDPGPDPDPDPNKGQPEDNTNIILGWTLTGAGAVTLLGSFIWDLALLSEINSFIADGNNQFAGDPTGFEDEKERLQGLRPLPLIGYGVGAALVGTGLVFLLLDAEEKALDTKPEQGAWRLTPLLSPDTAGASFQLRY